MREAPRVRERCCVELFAFLVLVYVWIGGPFYNDATAQTSIPLSKEELAWIEAHPVVHVAATKDWPPFEFEDSNGEFRGISSDVLRLVCERLGLKTSYAVGSWEDLFASLKAGELDVSPGMSPTSERQEFFHFTKAYVTSPVGIWVEARNTSIKDAKDLAGLTVAIEENFYLASVLKEKYPQTKRLTVGSTLEALQAVASGKADAYLGSHAVGAYFIDHYLLHGIKLAGYLDETPMRLSFGVNRNLPVLRDILQKALDTVSSKEIREIQDRYFRDEKSGSRLHVELSPQEQAWLAKHPSVTVATAKDWTPIDFRSDDGHHAGITADYLHLIEALSGLHFDVVTDVQWSLALSKVKARELDGIVSISRTESRETFLNFSQPYFAIGKVIITRREDDRISTITDLIGRRVAVEKNYLIQEQLSNDYPQIYQVEVSTTLDALFAVMEEKADAYFGNLAVVHHMMESHQMASLKIAGRIPYPPAKLCIAFHKGIEPEAIAIINKALALVTPEDAKRIRRRWVGIDFDSSVNLELETLRFTNEEWHYLKSHKPLIFSEVPWEPLSITDDPETFQGIIADYLDLITVRSGLVFKFEPSDNWQSVLKKYADGEIDVIPALGSNDKVGRDILLSEPYITFPLIIVTRNDVPYIQLTSELNGKKVAVGRGYTSYQYLHNAYPKIQLIETDDVKQALLKVVNGEAYAFVGHMAVAIDSMQKLGLKGLKVAGETDYTFDHRIGIDPRYPEAVSIINKVLRTIDESHRREISQKWMKVAYEGHTDYSLLLKVIIAALIFLGVVFYWNRKLAKEVAFRKRVEDKLRIRDTAMTAAANAIVITDNQGAIRWVNPAFSELTGYEPEEAIGQNPRVLNSGRHSREFFEVMWQTLLKGETWRGELYNKRKDGTIYPEEMTITPVFNDKNVVTHFVAIKADIAKRKEMEREILDAKENAEDATRAKSEFLANMSHEIRTPMNAILGMTYLLMSTKLSAKQLDYISKIDYSAKALLRIINDILDFSKIEAGRLEIERIPFHLEDLLDNVSNLIQVKIEKKGLEFLFNIASDVPFSLEGDPLRLGQVLTNLLGNAVKFTERGEIVVEVEREEQGDDSVLLKFSVRDTGIGLSEDALGRLFQSFSQADTSTTRKYGGTGLGLAISKSLVSLMGGRIGVESEFGKGSRFWFTARLKLIEHEDASPYRYANDFKGMKVLVVDDNGSARKILHDNLKAMGFAPQMAESGYKAIEILENCNPEDPFQLVLMDWKMPELDGIETSRRIKSDSRLCVIPMIIMVTAYGKERVMRQAESIGLSGFLIKPVNPSVLFDAIMEAFGKSLKRKPSKTRKLDSVDLASIDGARVLLVEDNEINRQVASELLHQMHLEVDIAENGQMAVEATRQKTYDAILMDIQMPVMDGYSATRAIRKQFRSTDLPIIAMTANAMEGDREKSLRAGMNDHISKPVDPKKLRKVLLEWIHLPQVSSPTEKSRFDDRLAAEPENALPRLEGIDTSGGLARVGGNEDLYLSLLNRLREEFKDSASQINELWQSNRLEDATRLAHTVKGVAGNVGANDLYAHAALMENALSEGLSQEEVESALMQLEGTVAATMATLAHLPQQSQLKDSDSNPQSDVDPATVSPLLEDLEAALIGGKPKSCQTILAQLERYSWQPEVSKLLVDLKKDVKNYDYKSAIEVLGRLKLRLY